LLERLLGRVLDLLTILLSTGTLTGVSLVRDYDLVNEIFVVFTTKYGFRRFELGSSLTLVIQELELH
jgi:hypothetical protein